MDLMENWKYTKSKAESFRRLSSGEAGYLAALLDGEGNYDISKSGKLRITVTNTNPRLVYLCDRFGGFWGEYKKKKRKIAYKWYWTQDMCKFYLPQISRYVVFKIEQFIIFWNALQLCHGIGVRRNKKKLMEYRERLQALH